LVAAGVAFLILFGVGVARFPSVPGASLSALPIVLLALIGVPATVVLNAAEYGMSARLLNRRPLGADALRVSILSSAANLLPLPGAALVRSRALTHLGDGYARAIGATVLVGLTWLAVTLALAGVVITVTGTSLGLVPLIAGVLGVVVTYQVARRKLRSESLPRVFATLVVVEVAFVAVSGLRLWFALAAVGFPDLPAAAAMSIASVVATAVGFFPGGLGLREALSAAMAPLVGLPPEIAIVASGLDRLTGTAVLGVATLVLLRFRRFSTPQTDS